MKEEIEWIDIRLQKPDNNKDVNPLLVKRSGSFKFGIWNRLSYHKDENDISSEKLYHWVVSTEIKYWARVEGIIED